jgi:crossover junction endodeoxyribonuclease RusA
MNAETCSIELELPIAISENQYRRYVPGCNHPVICAAGRKFHELVKHRFADSGQRKINGPVAVTLDFYPPDNRKRDLDNQFKCLFDSIVRAGCIADDACIQELHAYKREPVENHFGMNFIRITPAEKLTAGTIRALIRAGRLADAISKFGIAKVSDFLQHVA